MKILFRIPFTIYWLILIPAAGHKKNIIKLLGIATKVIDPSIPIQSGKIHYRWNIIGLGFIKMDKKNEH